MSDAGTPTRTPRVIVTGANGRIGRLVIDAWRASGRYQPVGIGRQVGPYADVVADIGNLELLVDAFRGADAVVHLAATASVTSPWDAVLHSNLIGTYSVFEAARLAGVERVVFASSNHAIGTYEKENAPALYELDDSRVWDHTVETRPDSLYGVSKIYGEALARYYVDHHGMRAFCLRIGGMPPPEAEGHPSNLWSPKLDTDEDALAKRRRTRAVWLSERDCVQIIERCLESDHRWVLCYGISGNPRRFWDIEHARDVLGFAPRDSAPAEILPDRG